MGLHPLRATCEQRGGRETEEREKAPRRHVSSGSLSTASPGTSSTARCVLAGTPGLPCPHCRVWGSYRWMRKPEEMKAERQAPREARGTRERRSARSVRLPAAEQIAVLLPSASAPASSAPAPKDDSADLAPAIEKDAPNPWGKAERKRGERTGRTHWEGKK